MWCRETRPSTARETLRPSPPHTALRIMSFPASAPRPHTSRQALETQLYALRDIYARGRAMVDGAALIEAILDDLQVLWATEDGGTLSLSEASHESGYSADHLRRLVRQGAVRATRNGRHLTFQRGDLPRKPGSARTPSPAVDAATAERYDPVADARRVAARRNGGGPRGA